MNSEPPRHTFSAYPAGAPRPIFCRKKAFLVLFVLFITFIAYIYIDYERTSAHKALIDRLRDSVFGELNNSPLEISLNAEKSKEDDLVTVHLSINHAPPGTTVSPETRNDETSVVKESNTIGVINKGSSDIGSVHREKVESLNESMSESSVENNSEKLNDKQSVEETTEKPIESKNKLAEDRSQDKLPFLNEASKNNTMPNDIETKQPLETNPLIDKKNGKFLEKNGDKVKPNDSSTTSQPHIGEPIAETMNNLETTTRIPIDESNLGKVSPEVNIVKKDKVGPTDSIGIVEKEIVNEKNNVSTMSAIQPTVSLEVLPTLNTSLSERIKATFIPETLSSSTSPDISTLAPLEDLAPKTKNLIKSSNIVINANADDDMVKKIKVEHEDADKKEEVEKTIDGNSVSEKSSVVYKGGKDEP